MIEVEQHLKMIFTTFCKAWIRRQLHCMYAQFIIEDGSGQQHLPYFSCNDLRTNTGFLMFPVK